MIIKDLSVEIIRISIMWYTLEKLKDKINNSRMCRYNNFMKIDKLNLSIKN